MSASRKAAETNWSTIPGKELVVFRHMGRRYSLSSITVYRDGKIFDGTGDRVSVAGLKRSIAEGHIRTSLPEGATVHIPGLVRLTARDVKCRVREPELLKEVVDVIAQLNGRPTSATRCRQAFARYNAKPSVATRRALRKAYEAVPEHNRPYLGDMDLKDIPIRMVIYGDQELERWSHRLIGRVLKQDPLPTIRVKQIPSRKRPRAAREQA